MLGLFEAGPLGLGLLASGLLGTIIRGLQASVTDPDHALPSRSQIEREDGNRPKQPIEGHVSERLA